MRTLQTSRIFSSNLTIKICQKDAWNSNRKQLRGPGSVRAGSREDFTWCRYWPAGQKQRLPGPLPLNTQGMGREAGWSGTLIEAWR